jgi:hypothetical protein
MRPRRLSSVTFEELPDDEIVLVNPDRSVSLILNPMGNAIWELCDGSRSIEEITAFVCETLSGANFDRVSEDIATLVKKLVDVGMAQDLDACGGKPSEL